VNAQSELLDEILDLFSYAHDAEGAWHELVKRGLTDGSGSCRADTGAAASGFVRAEEDPHGSVPR
jgi:hypothetical protein